MQTDYANMLELLRTYELHNIQNREKNIRNAKLRPWYNLSRNEPAVPLFLCQFHDVSSSQHTTKLKCALTFFT